jgi:hypothetical protein
MVAVVVADSNSIQLRHQVDPVVVVMVAVQAQIQRRELAIVAVVAVLAETATVKMAQMVDQELSFLNIRIHEQSQLEQGFQDQQDHLRVVTRSRRLLQAPEM